MDHKTQRTARSAHMRNLVLRAAGYGDMRVPECELRGIPDKQARLTFLCSARADIAWTRSDRTMVVRNRGGHGGWWCVVDDVLVGGGHPSKASALAAGRAAEKAADKLAAHNANAERGRTGALPPLPPLRDITAWMKTPGARARARTADVRLADASLTGWISDGRPF